MKQLDPKKLRFAVLATDVVLFTLIEGQLKTLLITVNAPPYFINVPGLPGSLILPHETAEMAAIRNLSQKAGIQEKLFLEQFYSFSNIKRDPRGRVVSIGYFALVSPEKMAKIKTPSGAVWQNVFSLPKLAYDHNQIAALATKRLQGKITYTGIIQHLLPKEFTLGEMQNAYEIILRKKMDKRNFRKKILKLGMIKNLSRQKRGIAHRPAQLYVFTAKESDIFEIV